MTASDNTGSTRQVSIDSLDDDDLRILVEKCQQLREAHENVALTYGEIESLLRRKSKERNGVGGVSGLA